MICKMMQLTRETIRAAAWLMLAVALLAPAIRPHDAVATVFLAKDEAIALAFGGCAPPSQRSSLLSSEQRHRVEDIAKTKLKSSIFSFYEARCGSTTRYAVIDSRVMRTNQAAFLVVLSKELAVEKVLLLAFNEPTEYMPTRGWLSRLEGDASIDELIPGRAVPPIAGSTLSANGVSDGIRAVRASFEVALHLQQAESAATSRSH